MESVLERPAVEQNSLEAVIEEIDLSSEQRLFLCSRWLDQVRYMESRAKHAQRRYYALRLITIVGGVTVPALVSLNVPGSTGLSGATIHWATFLLSLLVALSAAVEEFFRFGERWRHFRATAESLKAEAWQFFPLTGPHYRRFSSHSEAYGTFASRVEEVLAPSIQSYISELAREKGQESEKAAATAVVSSK